MLAHIKISVALAALLGWVTLLPVTLAHTDAIAPLARVEKVYAAPAPIGELRGVYTAGGDSQNASLSITCDLFQRTIPAAGLDDLPRPDWSSFTVAYSLTSFENGEWTQRPYLYVQVRLHGPVGQSWDQTWATLHFDADGNLTRKVKRFVPMPELNSIRVLWENWEIGSDQTAEEILKATHERSR